MKVDEVHVQSKTGEMTTVKKQGDASGRFTSPTASRAGETAVQGLTSTLVNMEVTRVIDENPTDLKQPWSRSRDDGGGDGSARTSDNRKTMWQKIAVGDRTRGQGAALYAKRNDEKRVFLDSVTYQEAEINKSTFDLRYRQVPIVSFQR